MTMPYRPTLAVVLVAGTLLGAAAPALAATTASDDDQHHQSPHTDADATGEDIVVVGHLPTDFGLLASTASLRGDDLVERMQGQVGEILARLPGVSATSFAPGVSRPVLRGFDGDRIRVLVDGIGSIDASNVSADHAVVFDALTVDHIDVVHGPAVLLFGGQAIGGAVNAIDKRIPRSVPASAQVTALAAYGSAARERSAGASLDVPLADRLVAHVDADWRKSDDERVGGFVNSAPLRAELLAQAASYRADGDTDAASELEGYAGQRGRIANSATRSTTLGAGIAFIDAGGNLGLSVQRHTMRYGVPLRPAAGASSSPPVHIGLAQTRVDLRGSVAMDGLFDSLQLRGAFGDYRHTEFEGNAAGTRFSGNGFEFRADLVQANHGGWRGRSGVQVQSRKLSIVGDEAVTPDNDVRRIGVFTLQSVELGSGLSAEAAGRFERASVKATTVNFDRAYDLWSGALGLTWADDSGLKIGANFTHGARAPAAEELLSNGVHAATQSYERGDPGFGIETSNGIEAFVRYEDDRTNLSLTGYATRFASFIAALPTGTVEDGMPVFQYTQLPARFIGFEAEASHVALKWNDGAVRLNAAADYTRGRLKGVGPVPRIPPLRLRGGGELELGTLHLHGEVEWNAAQKRIAAFEYPVKGFTLVNLSADWHPMGEDGPLTLIVSADNLLDASGRRAASFTRDFVPLAGRDIRVSAKVSF